MQLLNSRYIIVLLGIIFSGCFQTRKVENIPHDGELDLLMISNFKTSVDTIERTIHYKYFNLKQIIHKDTVTWVHNNDTIFIGNKKNYELLFEIHDSSSFIISYIAGEYQYFGPGVFRRDNLLFYNINSHQLFYTETNNLFIEESKERFIKQYCNKNSTEIYMNHVIDTIEYNEERLILLNSKCEKEYYSLKKIGIPYNLLN